MLLFRAEIHLDIYCIHSTYSAFRKKNRGGLEPMCYIGTHLSLQVSGVSLWSGPPGTRDIWTASPSTSFACIDAMTNTRRRHGVRGAFTANSLYQRGANLSSRGPKNEMISLGGLQLLSKEKHSAHFNTVVLYLSKNDIYGLYASEEI